MNKDKDFIVVFDNVSKRYGQHIAVENLSLDIPTGEVFALLGPNGAGKTTSIRMMLGLVQPSGGQITVCGKPVSDPDSRASVGYASETSTLYPQLTIGEHLKLLTTIYGMPPLSGKVEESLALFDLKVIDKIGRLSKGNRQKVSLLLAMVFEPQLLILDEPTSGLDPVARLQVLELIRRERGKGSTVILSSHVLPEVERVADSVAIMHKGKLMTIVRNKAGAHGKDNEAPIALEKVFMQAIGGVS